MKYILFSQVEEKSTGWPQHAILPAQQSITERRYEKKKKTWRNQTRLFKLPLFFLSGIAGGLAGVATQYFSNQLFNPCRTPTRGGSNTKYDK